MIKFSFFLVGLFVLKFIVSEASAQTKHQKNRNQRQKARISEGVESGSLTRNEARKLRKAEREIKKTEVAAASDGKITAVEKVEIQKMQNTASQEIKKLKHNKRNRKN